MKKSSLLISGLLAFSISSWSYADATLDKIKSRGEISVGVLLSGNKFGSIDPSTRQAVGFNVDLAHALAKTLGVSANLVQVQTATRAQFLQTGKVDILIANMEHSAERAEQLGFVPTPYYRVGGTALFKADKPYQDWSDLKDAQVCVSQGSSYTRPVAERYGAKVRGFKTYSESLLALQSGTCDVSVHDSTLLRPLKSEKAEWQNYRYFDAELNPAPSVLWVRQGENDTIAALDEIVRAWHKEGLLIELEQKNAITPPNPALVEWRDAAQ